MQPSSTRQERQMPEHNIHQIQDLLHHDSNQPRDRKYELRLSKLGHRR